MGRNPTCTNRQFNTPPPVLSVVGVNPMALKVIANDSRAQERPSRSRGAPARGNGMFMPLRTILFDVGAP